MTHDEATKGGATERYVLEEMTDEERDAFEEHYFDCAVCAEDVKAAIAVRDEGLAAIRDLPEPVPAAIPFPQPKRWFATPMATAASIAFALMFGWVQFIHVPALNTTIAQLREISVPQLHIFSDSRDEQLATFDGRRTSEIAVRVDPPEAASAFAWTILDASGSPKRNGQIAADQVQDDLMLHIVVAPSSLDPGKYTLRVLSKHAAEYQFVVR